MTTARDAHGTRPVMQIACVLSVATGAVAVAVSALLAGLAGLTGALIGAGLVLGFFGAGHLVLTRLRSIDPATFFLIAMLTYVLQVVSLLAVFGSFASWSAEVSATALGVTIIVCTLAWTTGLVLSSRRQRIPLFDLGEEPR